MAQIFKTHVLPFFTSCLKKPQLNPCVSLKAKILTRQKMLKKTVKKGLIGSMSFAKDAGKINWFPGHMASATRAIKTRLKLTDLVIEVRDARIPLSSANEDLQSQLSSKRRIIALNKKDLANPNILNKWTNHFESKKQDCVAINAHSRGSVQKLLELVELRLKEVIAREPTLLVMVVGVPNVGKSALINSVYQIAATRFPEQKKRKRATVGPLPGVTQDIAGFKIAHRPSIYVLDSPGVLVPSIPDIETGLKLALSGSIKDSVVGEERLAQYFLAILNTRGTPLHWKYLFEGMNEGSGQDCVDKPSYNLKDIRHKRNKQPDSSAVRYVGGMIADVQRSLYTSLSEFDGDIEDENDLECLMEQQFEVLQKALKIPHKTSEGRLMVAKKFLTLFRTGRLGPFILDDVPEIETEPSNSRLTL